MDFQRLFKRKEEGALPVARDNTREILNERDVLVREGELFDGQSPASVVWSKVGGAISVKADKILGILEGRTRIKGAVLHELYPGLFEKPPNPGTEFTIPLRAVVTQLQDVFAGVSPEEADLEDFDTPFGQLAREDEARFKNGRADRPGKIRSYETTAIPTAFDKSIGKIVQPSATNGTQNDLESQVVREEPPKPVIEELFPVLESGHPDSAGAVLIAGAPNIQSEKKRRQGYARLQELYLTDEPLDGSKVASLILQLPGVAGVVIMLSDGAVLGGGLSGGLSEGLLSLTPDFVRHLRGFTQDIEGGPPSFATISSDAFQVCVTIGGDVLILSAHEGKRLPPGLRERLVATAQAVNMIYGTQS
ncbi:MAG TPA: hypothetical protein VK775_06130 [Chthoniobacterales bacterium]|nr:hypothetical protein [Chthoniobacterales bacterium]